MTLKEFFGNDEIINNGSFRELGYSHGQGKDMLTFCDTIAYLAIALDNKDISAIIISKDLVKYIDSNRKGIAISDSPRNDFFEIYNYMRDNELFEYDIKYGIEPSATIAKSAIISKNSYVGKNTVVSDNVIIKDNVYIGDNCYIDCGVIIGNEGILYKQDNGNNIFIRHAGIVKIDSNVTILSNAVIVKSVFQNIPTVIGKYSIIGIATTIGHEARIGKNCRVLGNCVVAKNAQLGDNTIIGSSSVIRENITLGKNVDVKAGSIVIKDIKDGGVVSGNFALNHNLNVKNYFKSQK